MEFENRQPGGPRSAALEERYPLGAALRAWM